MESNIIKQLRLDHWGKILGALVGLLTGLLFIWYGFWKALLIIFFLVAGVISGIKLEQSSEFRKYLEQIWRN